MRGRRRARVFFLHDAYADNTCRAMETSRLHWNEKRTTKPLVISQNFRLGISRYIRGVTELANGASRGVSASRHAKAISCSQRSHNARSFNEIGNYRRDIQERIPSFRHYLSGRKYAEGTPPGPLMVPSSGKGRIISLLRELSPFFYDAAESREERSLIKLSALADKGGAVGG